MPPNALFKVVNAVHRPLFQLTKGKVGGRGLGMPVLVLTTVGRTSGQKRSSMLPSPLQPGDSIVLVASRGGDDRNPDWFHNLVANPRVEVEMDGVTRPMTARVADATERPELWSQIVAAHDNYAGYQRRTDREIPVVVLDPA
ncbi:MAG: nitroreductase family deazaflavin-dependent oxidoreductase [Acidimicrobiia bacterium]